MFINWHQRELNLKIVYYGAGMSGKTTNLEKIHERVDPKRRGDLVSLKTNEDRTLFFDFLRLELGKIGGMTPKIHLYTVPGQTYYEASRKVVLRGTDGIVFVVDSAPDRVTANLELWQNMKIHLSELDIPLTNFPIVVQFNKRDLSNALPVDTLKKLLRVDNYPTFEAIAIEGQGVSNTLKAVINDTIKQVQRDMV